MTKNIAEDLDKKDGTGGRIVGRGTVSIGGTAEEPEQPGVAGSSIFGAVDAVVRKPWFEERDADAVPLDQVPVTPAMDREARQWVAKQAGSVEGSQPKPLPEPVVHVADPTETRSHKLAEKNADDVYQMQVDRHGRIAVSLVHELKITNEAAARAASRIMLEQFAVVMRDNPLYQGP